jgi:cytidylate kinase
MADLIVTIDGPAASGKSTVARRVARRLGAAFLDTGATYRAATLVAVQAGVDLGDATAVRDLIAWTDLDLREEGVFVNGQDVTDLIRTPELTARVHHLARAAAVRQVLVDWQRAFAARHKSVVTEGRDQGTVVFPEAQAKIFLTASARERAKRRHAEQVAKGIPSNVDQIEADIAARDESDRNREVGPLKPAPDAIEVDTTGLTIEQVVDRIVSLVFNAMDR